MTTLLIAAAILTGMIFFILGGIIGYLIASSGVYINNKVSKFSNSQANKMAKINIDDTKFVVDIKTGLYVELVAPEIGPLLSYH